MENWYKTLDIVINDTIELVKNMILNNPMKPVVIFEIDNVLIIDDEIIKPVKKFYDFLIHNNINIIYVTSRIGIPEIIDETKSQLKKFSLNNYELMYFIKQNRTNISNVKNKIRKNIVDKGYNILISCGNKDHDFLGDNIGIPVKIPSRDSFYIKEVDETYF